MTPLATITKRRSDRQRAVSRELTVRIAHVVVAKCIGLAVIATVPAPAGVSENVVGEAADGPRPARHRFRWLLLASLLLAGVAALRLIRLNASFDIFVDEITYLRLSQSVSENFQVLLYGKPFFLHPPAFFFLEGAFVYLFAPLRTGSILEQVQAARFVNVGLAVATAGALWSFIRSTHGRSFAPLAVGIFAIDPFIIRLNSRNLLETSAMLWIVLGYLALGRLTAGRGDARARRVLPLIAGVAFGLAILTKDTTALVTLLPLFVCFVLGWSLPRRTLAGAAAVAAITYLPYPVIVGLTGHSEEFTRQKGAGALRLAGTVQETGFNRPGSVSFTTKLMNQLGEMGPSYLLMAVGVLLALVLLGTRRPEDRLVAAWVGATVALVGYSILFGTLEEQMFYFLAVPCLAAVALAAPPLLRPNRTYRRSFAAVVALLATLYLVGSGATWWRVHTRPDDGHDRLVAYLDLQVPQRTDISIAGNTEITNFVLDRFSTYKVNSVSDLSRHRIEYVVLSTKAIDEGYSIMQPEAEEWVRANGVVMFQFQGPSVGVLLLYRVPAVTASYSAA